MKKAVLFWSAGKDSAMTLHSLKQDPQVEIMGLVTTLNSGIERISMHGISEKVLDRQVEQLGFPIIKMWVPNQPDYYSYEEAFLKTCTKLLEMGVDTLVFGDIFLEDLRAYREELASKAGLNTYFPLWKRSANELKQVLTDEGFEAITCCVQSDKLGNNWIGKQLNADFFKNLPSGIDPFGENGEFHTFCYKGPVFRNPINFETGEVVFKPLQIKQTDRAEDTGFLYLDII